MPTTTAATLRELEETLLTGSRILDAQGIVDTSGHLSFRIPGTDRFVLPARMAPGLAKLEHLMVVDADGAVVEGDGTRPLEWAIHARIYAARPEVMAVMHSHSAMSRVFSVSDRPLKPIFGIATPWLHTEVPVYRGCGPISSGPLGDRVAEVLGGGPALLLRAHGNVIVGGGIEETVVRAIVFEQVATTRHQALSQGEVVDLTDEEIAEWQENTPSGHGKAWAYYTALGRTEL